MCYYKYVDIHLKCLNNLEGIILDNNQCSTIIESTLDFSYLHLLNLMQSPNCNVQLKASNALATFIYNKSRIQLYLSKQYQLSFEYFQKFLQSNNDYIRSTAGFQVCFRNSKI
jgi:hypothetical protein